MHAPAKAVTAAKGHQWLFELACPGPVDRPHPANCHLGRWSWFWEYEWLFRRGRWGWFKPRWSSPWNRWAHARRCIGDIRSHGKVYCKPDITEEQAVARELEWALCCSLDRTDPRLPDDFRDRPPPRHVLHEPRKAIAEGQCDDTELALSIALRLVTVERWSQAPWPHRAKNRLIADHVWICEEIAKKYRGEAEEDDLQQEGTFGLYKALRKFDPRSGKFSTLAWRAVEWAIKDYLKRLRRLQRHQSSDEISASGDESVLGIYARNSVEPADEN
jgi:Sigma-70 region 2